MAIALRGNMKEHPIIFNPLMVQKILEGKKTQTRRVINLPKNFEIVNNVSKGNKQPKQPKQPWCTVNDKSQWGVVTSPPNDTTNLKHIPCPYGQVGDRLWVRETWRIDGILSHGGGAARIAYKADNYSSPYWRQIDNEGAFDRLLSQSHADADKTPGAYRWRPSIHMFRWASRILLEITDIRIEHLNAISQADAMAEGAPPSHPSIDHISMKHGFADFSRSWFGQLWDEINGDGAWKSNPLVWVVEFKIVEIEKETA